MINIHGVNYNPASEHCEGSIFPIRGIRQDSIFLSFFPLLFPGSMLSIRIGANTLRYISPSARSILETFPTRLFELEQP